MVVCSSQEMSIMSHPVAEWWSPSDWDICNQSQPPMNHHQQKVLPWTMCYVSQRLGINFPRLLSRSESSYNHYQSLLHFQVSLGMDLLKETTCGGEKILFEYVYICMQTFSFLHLWILSLHDLHLKLHLFATLILNNGSRQRGYFTSWVQGQGCCTLPETKLPIPFPYLKELPLGVVWE